MASEEERGLGCARPEGVHAPDQIPRIAEGFITTASKALINTEGTVTVSTDHTNGSSLETAANPAVSQHFATPMFGNAEGSADRTHSGQPPMDEPDYESLRDVVSPPRHETDAIEFRVIRPGVPVRRLRLTGNRYTFGSAEGCSIRLNDLALRPMHAVLIRDASRILVRAYSVPIEVNGTRTTEATLGCGDVLRLGAYQFELLTATRKQSSSGLDSRFSTAPRSIFDPPPNRPEVKKPRSASASASASTSTSTSASTSASTSSQPAANRETPTVEDLLWRDRLRREIDQWRDRQTECDRRESRCDDRESDLRNRETELWSRAENLYRRESRLQSQEAAAFQLYDEFTERQQELIQLREETQSRHENFQRREAEFRNQEFEYRSRLEEATRQLQQSKHQAETATQAVQRMREQFESLNQQIEELSNQQEHIELRERKQREEHERLRRDLEVARDNAIDGKAESEARRREAEARVEQMTAQIELLKAGQGSDLQEQQERLQQSERVIQQLREQVADLQKTVAEAREESSLLRSDYEGACESVRQLESLVSQNSERGERERESWAAEADALREAIDQLSVELARANSELSDLRDANQELTTRLEGVQQQRDEARADADSRPSSDAFASLRQELEVANDQLSQMKLEYEETLARLEQSQRKRDLEIACHHQQALLEAASISTPVLPEPTIEGAQDRDRSGAEDGAWPTDSGAVEKLDFQSHEPTARSPYDAMKVAPAEDSTWGQAWATENPDGDPMIASAIAAAREQQSLHWQRVADDDADADFPEHTAAWQASSSMDAGSGLAAGVPGSEADSHLAPQDASPWDTENDSPWSSAAASSQAAAETQPEETPVSEALPASSYWNDATSTPHESVEQPETSWPEAAFAGNASDGDSASVWQAEPESVWTEPASADESEIESSHLESSHYESLAEPVSPEMTSVWEQASGSIGVEHDPNAWPQADDLPFPEPSDNDSVGVDAYHVADDADVDAAQADTPGEEPDADGDSLISGSLASMLIRDLEEESRHQSPEYDGTYVMDKGPETSSWSQPEEEIGWDEEHTEESIASQWSNDPSGYRVEQIEDADMSDDSFQQPEQLIESELAVESEPNDSYDEPQPDPLVEASEVEDDDSIEAYMNRLLRRVQGESPTLSPQPETVTVSTSRSKVLAATNTEIVKETSQEAVTEPVDPDAPLVPRSLAPEKNSNMSAMRELANASARNAISRSTRIQSRDTQIKGMTNFACAAGALLCGAACFYFLPGVVRYLAVAMTAIVAATYIREGLQLFSEANRRLKAAEAGNPGYAEDAETDFEVDEEFVQAASTND